MAEPKITMYVRPGCFDVERARYTLEKKGLTWTEIDIDQDSEAEARVIEWAGRAATPTIWIGDTLLVEPDREEIDEALAAHRQ